VTGALLGAATQPIFFLVKDSEFDSTYRHKQFPVRSGSDVAVPGEFYRMKVSRRKLVPILGLVLMCLPCCAFAAAYTNGSFENVADENDALSWTEVPSAAGAIGYPTDQGATDGIRALAFNLGNNPSGSVDYQTFDTLAGRTYVVFFDFGNVGASTPQVVQLEMRNGSSFNSGSELINGDAITSGPGDATLVQNNSLIRVQDNTGTPANAPNEFTRISFTFTAISTTTTVVLTDQAPTGGLNSDAMIDNLQIALSAIPESSTWVMSTLISGFLAFLFWRQRSGKLSH
jgi:hypothetical protein